MSAFPSLPTLPEWVPYPLVVWFVVEGVLIGLAGVLIRDGLGSLGQTAVVVGNIFLFVGTVSAVLGALAYVVLVAVTR